jgi:hypothetical protein
MPRSTMADRFTASKLSFPDIAQTVRSVQHKTRLAEKFVFDAEASARVATVLRDVPELLVEQIQFARPPFDLCWIEYDVDVIFAVLNPDRTIEPDETRDVHIGLLIEHHRMTVVSEDMRGRFGIMPAIYHLNTEWPLEEQLALAAQFGTSRMGIDFWLWGSLAPKLIEAGKQDYLRALRDTNRVEWLLPIPPSKAASVYNGTIGDFKNHVAMLLMLNQPACTQYAEVPRGRGWIGNKPKPFMAHRTVHVALDPVPHIRQFGAGTGGSVRRRHRVRGHYCTNLAARSGGCIHQWQAAGAEWKLIAVKVGDDPERWVCAACGGRRWWRADHARGDASIGWVNHTYKVD